ncbi:EAL domain-containing protein [Ideonella sp. DXS29W]|uniref:EAL domain-containing protein n=1 Tax=Ideonella lacteola TaxID=2984193 RepID=A0ABU9BL73_9BURK
MSGSDAGIAWLTGQTSARAELLDMLDDPAWLVDANDRQVLHANQAAADWFGVDRGQMAGRRADSLLTTLEDAAFWADVQNGVVVALNSETELTRPDGRIVWAHRRIMPIGTPLPGRQMPGGFLVTLRDRSQEYRAERQRDSLLAELRATLESTADGILVTDLQGRIQAFNRRFAALWSLPESALAERDDEAIHRWMSAQTVAPASYQARLAEIEAHALLSAVDTVHLLDGARLERHIQPQWSRGRPIGRVYSFRELNPQRRGAPRLQRGGVRDESSHWPERNGFVAQIDDAVGLARRDGTPMALLCIEFDRDSLFALEGEGQVRAMGDVVEGLRALVPVQHQLARLGGARFGVLLRQCGEASAEALARRIVDQGRTAHGLLATTGLMVSVGIAAYPQAGLSAEDLLDHAEKAMERARHAGSSAWRVHAFDATDDGQRLARLHRTLREGGAGQSLRLRYLPRIDAVSGRVQCIEALLRWHDGEHGLLPPAQFLPLAARAGLAGALDDWALEHALHQAARWRAAGFVWRVSLNLSSWQCLQPGLARRVEAALQVADWPAELLELDLHEAALQADPELTRAQLRALRELGVHLVLDDYGSGDACLNLLRRFPLDAVKLDRDLVHGLARGATPEAGLAVALAGAARACSLAVYAEGVETETHRQSLLALGISGWQGFLFSRPLDAASVPARLAHEKKSSGGLARVKP